ncbi:hypothetical protein CaCOL14_013253 [Colletotrichum acutatum]
MFGKHLMFRQLCLSACYCFEKRSFRTERQLDYHSGDLCHMIDALDLTETETKELLT